MSFQNSQHELEIASPVPPKIKELWDATMQLDLEPYYPGRAFGEFISASPYEGFENAHDPDHAHWSFITNSSILDGRFNTGFWDPLLAENHGIVGRGYATLDSTSYGRTYYEFDPELVPTPDIGVVQLRRGKGNVPTGVLASLMEDAGVNVIRAEGSEIHVSYQQDEGIDHDLRRFFAEKYKKPEGRLGWYILRTTNGWRAREESEITPWY